MSEGRLTGLALLHTHRDIPVSAQVVIERFAKRKKHFLDFVIRKTSQPLYHSYN